MKVTSTAAFVRRLVLLWIAAMASIQKTPNVVVSAAGLFGLFGGSSNNDDGFDIYDWVFERITGGSSYNPKTIVDETKDDETIVAAYKNYVDGHLKKASATGVGLISNRTLRNTIHEDRRFVLYNSRRLSGECLPICYETATPTRSPVAQTITEPPSASPRTSTPTGTPTHDPTGSPTRDPTGSPTRDPTGRPTDEPTHSPTDNPTNSPTNNPTNFPSKNPTQFPTNPPTSGCQCPVNDDHGGSFKCGKDVYLCPGITAICAAQSNSNPDYWFMNAEECEQMKKVELGEKCIAFPDQGLTQTKALSNRVCYGGPYARPGYKVDGDGCESCRDLYYPPTPAPVQSPTNGGNCDTALANLGLGFDKATGNNAHTTCWPKMNTRPSTKDDSVNLFVGGNVVSGEAVEVEGKVVVLGDLDIKSNGWGDIGFVGGGYYVLPNAGQDCLVVGGNVKAAKNVRVGGGGLNCNMRYGSSNDGSVSRFSVTGSKTQDSNMDLSHYQTMKQKWNDKSLYWANLPTTGRVTYGGQPTFHCTDDNIQVFRYDPTQAGNPWGYSFDASCKDKTILVNVLNQGSVTMAAKDIYLAGIYNHIGQQECHIKTNILWNYPYASKVTIGNGSSEWVGANLVVGDLKHGTSGMSGRVIVLGNLEHNAPGRGSEFHAMEFNPPYPLPDPDCDDYLANGVTYPTNRPVSPPTPQPVYTPPTPQPVNPTNAPQGGGGGGSSFAGCKKKGTASNGVTDSNCSQCANGYKWWPCDMNPPTCEGDGCSNSPNYKSF